MKNFVEKLAKFLINRYNEIAKEKKGGKNYENNNCWKRFKGNRCH